MEFVCGAAAGIFATILTHPLDTATVLRQTKQQGQLVGWRKGSFKEGAQLFYRGLGPALFQASLIYGVMFGVYETLRTPSRNDTDGGSSGGSGGDRGRCGWGWGLIPTAMAVALPEAAVKGPLESLKNLRQTKSVHLPRGTPVIRSLLASPALTGILLKGTALMVAREIPGNLAYFGGFEAVRGAPPRQPAPLCTQLAGGAAAATCFTICLFPVDSFRAQVVTGIPWKMARPSYRGVGFYWCRAVAFTSILFAGWETAREFVL
jgi:hypothetical protein